jgi:allantoin racemase
MAVVVINPNSTKAMTEAMTAAAAAAAPSLRFEGWTNHDAPAAIQGEADGRAATPPLLKLVARAAGEGADGIIIGCFDDTGLAEAAASVACPVIGIGQAAYHFCAIRQRRFSVVTTLAVSIPVIEANIAGYGLAPWLGRVRASGVPVLALEADPAAAMSAIRQTARNAERDDGAQAVILGCAGMTHVAQDLRASLNCAVIEPVETAAVAMLWMLGARPPR